MEIAFIRPRNITFDCYVFFSRKQKKGEMVEQFYSILKELAENCHLENREEVIIRDIFITNMLDDDIQRELLRDTVDPERALGVKKQATVALSSSEAEYQGMAAAVQEALYLKQLLEDFKQLREDNQSCIRLCQNPVEHKRSKHIETKFHLIWDKTEDGTISLRSYRQIGSGHLHKVLTRSESGNNQSSFDGNRLYAISSSLSGGVRILIQVLDLNLVLLEGLTNQINLTEDKLIQVSNTDINES